MPDERDNEATTQEQSERDHLPLYRSTTEQETGGRVRSIVSRHRRKLAIGGAVVALLGAGGVGLFLFLAPLKLTFLAKNIEDVRQARLNNVFERRSQRFITSYLAANIAGDRDDGRNNYFIAKGWEGTGNPFVRWYKDLRATKFVDAISDRYGFQLASESGTGRGRLTAIGVLDLDEAEIRDIRDQLFKGGGIDPKNIPDYENRLRLTFETDREARLFLRKMARDETHWLQILKRRHMRLWAGDRLGVRRWAFFEGTREQTRNAVRARWTRSVNKFFDGGGFFSCLFNSQDCPDSRDLSDTKSKSLSTATGDPDATKTTEEFSSDGGRESRAEVGRATRRFTQIAIKNIIRGVSIILLVDTIDSIHELAKGDGLPKLVSVARTTEYANAFFTFQTLTDQMKEGNNAENKVSSEEVNAALEMFDCVEFSDGYQQVMREQNSTAANRAFGRAYAQGQQSSSSSCPYAEVKEEQRVNNRNNLATKITDGYNSTFGIVWQPIHLIYHATGLNLLVDAVSGTVSEAANAVFQEFLKRTNLQDNYQEVLNDVGSGALEFLGGAPACVGDEAGGRLFNCVDGGAAVVQEQFLHSAGGRQLSDQEVAELNRGIAEEKATELANRSWADRLFSLEDPNSLVGRLALQAPTTANGAGSRLRQLTSTLSPTNWFDNTVSTITQANQPFTERATAQSNDNLYGLKFYGFSDRELNQEPWGGKNEAECRTEITQFKAVLEGDDQGNDEAEADAHPASICVLDDMVAQTLLSFSTDNNDGGIGSGSTTATETDLPSGTTQDLAKQILKHPKITFDPGTDAPFKELAAGQPASVPATGAKTDVSSNLLGIILKLANDGVPLRIGALTTGTHATNSFHYGGKAVDIANEEVASQVMRYIYENRQTLDINELFYDNPPAGIPNLDNGQPSGPIGGHGGHIHFSVNK